MGFLRYYKKLDLPISKEMKKGSKVHEDKEIEFLKNAIPTTWEDFVKSEEFTFTREKRVGMILGDVGLFGKIDKIEVDRNGIYVIDDKPHPKLYLGIKNQLLAYSVALMNYIKGISEKPLFIILRDRDTEKDVWKKEINEVDEKEVIQNIIKMRGILKGEITPNPTTNVNKCIKCAFNTNCDFSLIKNSEPN